MAQDARIGTELGGYKLVRVLGRGGMGAVYEALEPATGRRLALKLLHREALDDRADTAERFLREAEGAARVDHPNVARVHKLGRDPRTNEPFIVNELLPGGSLHDRLKKTGPLPWREAAALGAQVARGLEAIHAAGLVHRDLKPANVLFDENGRAKITDFGLVLLSGSDRLTRTGEIMGTPEYCAPEQADSAKHAGPPADLYSLGATIHALVTGDPPFRGSITEILVKLLSDEPAPLRKLAAEVPRELEALVLRLLSKQPDERPTASEAARELAAIAEGTASRGSSRSWVVVAGAAVVSGAALLVAAFGRDSNATSNAPQPTPPPTAAQTPLWYLSLKPEERPASLPPGISFGKATGEYVNEADGSVLRFVPASAFTTGSPRVAGLLRRSGHADETEKLSPVREVKLPAYFIGMYEVTIEQFRVFARKAKHVTTAERVQQGAVYGPNGWQDGPVAGVSFEHPDSPGDSPAPREPVSQVSWDDAVAYCASAGLRLPSEAEWERAALFDSRKQVTRLYAWGDAVPGAEAWRKPANVRDETLAREWPSSSVDLRHFAGYDDGFLRRAPVGRFPDGASPVGALDMTGNVAEWTSGVYEPATRDPQGAPPEQPPPVHYAFRGGGWCDRSWGVYGAMRDNQTPDYHSNNVGFRVARSYP